MKYFFLVLLASIILLSCSAVKNSEMDIKFVPLPVEWVETISFTKINSKVEVTIYTWSNGGSIISLTPIDNTLIVNEDPIKTMKHGIASKYIYLKEKNMCDTMSYSFSEAKSGTTINSIKYTTISSALFCGEKAKIRNVMYVFETLNYNYLVGLESFNEDYDKDAIVFEQFLNSFSIK